MILASGPTFISRSKPLALPGLIWGQHSGRCPRVTPELVDCRDSLLIPGVPDACWGWTLAGAGRGNQTTNRVFSSSGQDDLRLPNSAVAGEETQ